MPAWYDFRELHDVERNRRARPEMYREARRKVAEYCGFEDRAEKNDENIEHEAMSVDDDTIGPDDVNTHTLAATVSSHERSATTRGASRTPCCRDGAVLL